MRTLNRGSRTLVSGSKEGLIGRVEKEEEAMLVDGDGIKVEVERV